jgi:hypothetical protein
MGFDWLELLIQSYYNIVKRTMIDMVPKAIMLSLVQLVFRFPGFPAGVLTFLLDIQRRKCKGSS